MPWVIGAKKGFPNFNEFSMENPLTVSRKLEFTNSAAKPPWLTNQIFDVSITNTFGFEAWNSYTNSYNRPLSVTVSNELSIVVTNETGQPLLNVINLPFGTNADVQSLARLEPATSGSLFVQTPDGNHDHEFRRRNL